MRYMLVVKGSESEVTAELEKRGLQLAGEVKIKTSSVRMLRAEECMVHVEGDDLVNVLNQWFTEPGKAPFPAGHLLYWQPART